jgi:hypothetical protein
MFLEIENSDVFTNTVTDEPFVKIFILPKKLHLTGTELRNRYFKNLLLYNIILLHALERFYSFKDMFFIVILYTNHIPEFPTSNLTIQL